MKVVKTSELRQNLQEILNEIYYTKKPVIILKNGKPKAIVNPLPDNQKEIEKAIEKYSKIAK